jgi:hypothetical protein
MKKSLIKKICACVLVIIIMIMVTLFLKSSESAPHFKFLEGKGTLTKLNIENRKTSRETNINYSCSFQADYNDIYEKAKKELPESSLLNPENPATDYGGRMYCWRYSDSDEMITVAIHENRVLIVHNDRKDLERFQTDNMEGWVTVVVLKSKKQNWLIYSLNKLLDKLRD